MEPCRDLALIPLSALAPLGSACAPARVERRWTVMGTCASAEVYAATEEAAERAVAEI